MSSLLAAEETPDPASPRRPRRRWLRRLSAVLLVVGSLLVTDAVLTLAWKEPLTHFYTRMQQAELGDELTRLAEVRPTPAERREIERLPLEKPKRLGYFARHLDRRVATGHAIARLRIKRIGVNEVVVQGTDSASLRKGPGHYPETPLPGARGTAGIAGHRTTYGAPFRNIDNLEKGDPIVVELPYGRFEYAVESKRIVEQDALWITRRVGHDRLVLSACHPLYSADQRIVVFARLVRSQPRGAAT